VTGRTARRRVTRIALEGGAPASERADLLATEEPLGIRIGGQAASLTMRTPGDDIDLTAGFLLTEGIVGAADDIAAIRICSGEQCGHADHEGMGNIADVTLRAAADWQAPRRNFLTTSACGVCGKASIDDLRAASRFDLRADQVRVAAAVLVALPDRLREAQRVFERTGGLHAAGLFTANGTLLAIREDVGRHNAVDKVLGWAVQAGRLPLTGCILLVSGRASFELVQKAVMAGVPVLAAVSAPSSLAAELADEAGLTLIGFLRGRSMNAYAGPQRIRTD
jgi:FdhD protein